MTEGLQKSSELPKVKQLVTSWTLSRTRVSSGSQHKGLFTELLQLNTGVLEIELCQGKIPFTKHRLKLFLRAQYFHKI